MKSLNRILFIILLLLPAFLMAQEATTVEKCLPCEKLTELKLPDVKITEAVTVTEGSSHCRVMGVIGREIKFELLLPFEWNGIYTMGGGGGFVGSIQNEARSLVNGGYATSGTDTGHEGNGLLGNWALNDMERKVNFAHLAIHRTAEVSKAIIGNYYGDYPKYSYFIGCSRGGGQAMMEAQRYPDDFDGIVVGAPAFNWPAIGAEFIQNTRASFPVNLTEPLLTSEHIRILHEAVLSQCDMIDGLKDNILNNPTLCKFDFNALPKCQGDIPGEGCFTTQQLDAIRTIYAGIDLGNGFAYPGFPFGGENKPTGWGPWITSPVADLQKIGYPSYQAAFGIEMIKYLVLNDPDWDYLAGDLKSHTRELQYAAASYNATSTDYSGFKNHKGKIIFWHGWNDPALSAYSTIEHFNEVKAKDPEADAWMRLFVLPGVLHCGGGDGPARVDWISLIRDWVENGKAPERVVVSRLVSGKVVMTRPVFPYPAEAAYDGKGDPNVETSFGKK